MFCYQQNFFTPTKEVTPEQFWALVDAPRTREIIDAVRRAKLEAVEHRAAGHDELAKASDDEAAKAKKRLPAFIFQATFDETASKKGFVGRWRKQAATRLNGLVVLDVDHVESEELRMKSEEFTTADFKQRAKELGILLVYITPSGKGLKVVFKADPEKGNLIDNMNAMAATLGVEADQSCKDASRMSFICTRKDILFINEEELFTYENKEFAQEFESLYRSGNSRGSLTPNPSPTGEGGMSPTNVSTPLSGGRGAGGEALSFKGIPYSDIISEWWQLSGGEPQEGERNVKLYQLAVNLRAICDNKRELLMKIMPRLGLDEQELRGIVESACKEPPKGLSKPMREILKNHTAGQSSLDAPLSSGRGVWGEADMSYWLDDWGQQIEAMAKDYPCIREALHGLPVAGYAAGLFVTGAFLGTLLTRTWYYFYHRPEERRRLNYCVMVIGDPASGKSFATRLYKLLAAPIKTADRVGYDAVNRYKEETRQKGANKEKPKKPQVIIRDHPARTSNATFIQDMNNAVETVEGEPMHLHMLTFDSELDNATLTQRGGSWIDKTSLELKAFHNEEDGQAYSNLDSISGTFNVYWNYVYTGTPLSLQRKVTERNFGSGLATRLACIPLPPSGFRMMEMKRTATVNHAADEELKTWAFRLDGVKGELPLWPLVEEAWQWTNEHMEVAAYNQDKADELLLKRVAYYGVCVSAPFILMRHWEEWKQAKTFTIDDKDRALSRLVMDIQYRCQHHFFGEYARAYFDNMQRDEATQRRRTTKYAEAYRQLPKEFTLSDICKSFSMTKNSAGMAATRFVRDGYVERIKQGKYKKIKATLV